jgi:thiol-disulfide isomerase/thioredoxin
MLNWVRTTVLYAALALGANAAQAADPAALEALKAGDMRKLSVHAAPRPAGTAAFTDAGGAETGLDAFRGKWVVLNFWATWCAPCRKEMPALDALNAEFGGEDFAVVAVATGRNSTAAIERFFAETGVETIAIHLDPKQALAREMAVLGLPVTVIIDPEGREIARLTGDADWHGAEARALIAALLAGS